MAKGIGARSSGECWVSASLVEVREGTYNDNLISDDFDVWFPEMPKSTHGS